MIASLALALAAAVPQLSLAPWTGTAFATTTGSAVKYRLTIKGTPNTTLHVVASGFARGWLAAFCTPLVCSPLQVTVRLPASGQASYAFELIREDEAAPRSSGARIAAGGASLQVPVSGKT
ncbi:MAG TPA: hypothetical protein VMH02_03170 [Verrucomicrobiae bacterium]|nr:hypothetical protein [Verrucomicrobiae bacterium]